MDSIKYVVRYPARIVSGIPMGWTIQNIWPSEEFEDEEGAIKFAQNIDKHLRSHVRITEVSRRDIDWKQYKRIKD